MNENIRCCGNCRFYFEKGGECRRFPPQVWGDPEPTIYGTYSVSFPEVHKDLWCGEFVPEEQLFDAEENEIGQA